MNLKFLIIILFLYFFIKNKEHYYTPYFKFKKSYRSYPNYIGVHRYLRHYPPSYKTIYYFDKIKGRYYYFNYHLRRYVYI